MRREYFFLATTFPEASSKQGHPLARIKVGSDIEGNPYCAFESHELGKRYIEHKNLKKNCYLVPEGDIDKDDPNYDFSNGVLLFETFEQILDVYRKQNDYDFSKLVIPYLHVIHQTET